MKNVLTLLIAILFTAGMTFAQNNQATVNQLEVDNSDVAIAQLGNGNEATASQNNGNNFDIDITQEGSSHVATATQNGPNGSMDMIIRQIGGDNNAATVTQNRGQNHWADVLQQGSDNVLNLLQDNTSTKAIVSQVGNNNEAYLTQINKVFASTSNLTVTQDGDGNYAFYDAEGLGSVANNATIFQQFDDNYASVTQRFNIEGNNADLEQIGFDNRMTVEQLSDFNTATLKQHGNYNTATVIQSN